MAKPEIIGSIRSTYTRVVCMVCEEKNIDFILTETPLGSSELFAIHPLGRMPVLRHGELALFESKAIATYLDRHFPGPEVLPVDPRRLALTEQWVSFVNTVVDLTFIRTYLYAYIAPSARERGPDRAAIDRVMPQLRKQVSILDEAVARTGHLVDDQFTFADINLLPILYRFQQAPEGAQLLAESAHLSAYYSQHAKRPSFHRTIPPEGPPARAK